MSDEVMLIVIFILPLTAMAVVTMALVWFVALNARPLPRAAWMAGLAYLIIAPVYFFVPLNGLQIAGGLLAAFPMALIIFWYWYGDFRSRWVDEAAADGVRLENNNWKVGLAMLIATIVAAGIKVYLRHGFRGH